jgi:O-antigen/teichoic acid export membrane protein
MGKAETVAQLVGGSVVAGLSGVGVASTSMAAVYLGAALADFGLSSEIGRLSLTYPSSEAVRICRRALVVQAPLALIVAPVALRITLGHRHGVTLALLLVTGVFSSTLLGNTGLTAMFNGLANFRTPALWLGAARGIASVLAVVSAAVFGTVFALIGSFALGEVLGLIGMSISLRRQSHCLPERADGPIRLLRTHLWLGLTGVLNVLTNQSDSLLVASILGPRDLGIFSIASVLQNGVGTTALAMSTPFVLRAVRSILDRRPATAAIEQALAVAAGVAIALGVITWTAALLVGGSVARLAPLATRQGAIVLALPLSSTTASVFGAVCYAIGIGLARHRTVGIVGVVAGLVAAAAITGGAAVWGVIGAAAGMTLRDVFLLAITTSTFLRPRALVPPRGRAAQAPPRPRSAGV